MTHQSKIENRLKGLLRDSGYKFANETGKIVRLPNLPIDLPLYAPTRLRSIFDACEYLLPIVKDAKFYTKFICITDREHAIKHREYYITELKIPPTDFDSWVRE